jgi:hypothetical protein
MSVTAKGAEIRHNLVRFVILRGYGYEECHLLGCETVQQNLLTSALIMAAAYSSETFLVFLQNLCHHNQEYNTIRPQS